MQYEKKNVSEKLKDKKEKFANWKEAKFDPWYKYSFQPNMKRKKKEIKKSVKRLIKSYRKRKAERLKRKYDRPDNYNINVRNIENVESFNVGGKHRRMSENLSNNKQLPYAIPNSPKNFNYQDSHINDSPPINRLTYQPNDYQSNNMDLDKLSNWYEEIQENYQLGYYLEVKIQCEKFLNYFLSRLARYLQINFCSVDDFLFKVREKELHFQFYEEIDEYRGYLRRIPYKIGESAYTLHNIISKIIKRLYRIANNPY